MENVLSLLSDNKTYLVWIPVIAAVLVAIWLAVLQPFLSGYLSEAGKRLFDAHGTGARQSRIVNEHGSRLTPFKLVEVERHMSGRDLLEFYSNVTPYTVTIGDKDWTFPAKLEFHARGDGRVQSQPLAFKFEEGLFELGGDLDARTRSMWEILNANAKPGVLFNGLSWRIKDVIVEASGTTIVSEQCRYFDSLRTNFSMDSVVDKVGNRTLREMLHGETRDFEPFGSSPMPNHMGVVGIIMTRDKKLVVQRRSRNVTVRPETLSSSVSGTIEYTDIHNGTHTEPLAGAARALVREAAAEIGTSQSDILNDMIFLGGVREFRRGGFPDFYFFIRTDRSFAEITALSQGTAEAFEFDGLVSRPFNAVEPGDTDPNRLKQFQDAVNAILEHDADTANLTLKLGVALTYDRLTRHRP